MEKVNLKLSLKSNSGYSTSEQHEISLDQWEEIQAILSGKKMNKMPKELTAENGAKGLLIGEFYEEMEINRYDEDDTLEMHTVKIPVTWSTIKQIYAKIVEHFYQ